MYATNPERGVLGGKMGRCAGEKNLVILLKMWAKIGVIDPMIDIWMGPFFLKNGIWVYFQIPRLHIPPPPDRSDAEKGYIFTLVYSSAAEGKTKLFTCGFAIG